MTTFKCAICGKEFDKSASLTAHIKSFHKLTIKEYYDNYIRSEGEGYCKVCGKGPLRFNGLQGYTKFCSTTCSNIWMHSHRTAEQQQAINKKISKTNSSKEVQEKTRQTTRERYGVPNVMQLDYFKNKLEEIFMERYGVTNPAYNKEISNKISEKVTQSYINNKEEIVEKRRETLNAKLEAFMEENDLVLYSDVVDKYGCGWSKFTDIEIVKKYARKFVHKKDLKRIINYHNFENPHVSNLHLAIIEYIKSLGIKNIKINDRRVIQPYELDIYLPDYNVAIECNGDYYHNYHNIGILYHSDKQKFCDSVGIRLIHLFESNWVLDNDKCKSLISTALNKNTKVIYINDDCDLIEVDKSVAQEFIKNNCLNYQIEILDNANYIGIFYKNELVQVIQYLSYNGNFIYNIDCTKLFTSVINGTKELLKYFNRIYCIIDLSLYTFPEIENIEYIEYISWIEPQKTGIDSKYEKYNCYDSGREILKLTNTENYEDDYTHVLNFINKNFINYSHVQDNEDGVLIDA